MREVYRRSLTGFTLGLIAISSLLFAPPWAFAALISILLVYVLIFEWPKLFKLNELGFWLLMPFYPILPFLLIIWMQLHGYEMMNMLLITLVGAHDSGAYLIGKLWGKHTIYPSISPSKTWEGFAGGTALSYLFSLIFFGHVDLTTQLTRILPFVILISFCSLLGDLFESYLKRRAGIKDAGAVLPGHGGILDRIDGTLFASVAVFILRKYVRSLINL